MFRHRIALALSLAALCGAIAWVAVLAYQQSHTAPGYPEREASQHQDLAAGDVTLGYSTFNDTDQAVNYTYYSYQDGELLRSETIPVPALSQFAYGAHVAVGSMPATLRLVVYREGQAAPVADVTRYIQGGS